MFNTARYNRSRFNKFELPAAPVSAAGARVPVRTYRLILAQPESIPFFLVQSDDHTTPVPGLNPEVLFSSAGQPFRPAYGVISEIGNGWYGIMPSSRDILGVAPLLLVVPASDGVDPCTVRIEIMPISGVAPLRVDQTRYPLTFYMTADLDHVSPAVSRFPEVLIRKSAGEFAAPVGVVTEIGYGWYMCRPDKVDVDTTGPMVLEATATGADPTFEVYDVVGTLMDAEIDRYTMALLMVRTMLINSGLFTEGTCVISLEKMPFPKPSIPSVWINPGATGFDPELDAGGERYTLLTSPTFTLNVVVRRMQDIEAHDQNWLTHVKRGAYPIIWKIVNLLAGKFIYSVAGDLLTTRHLRPVGIGNPYRYRDDQMVSVVPITFTTNVQIDVDIEYPYIKSDL